MEPRTRQQEVAENELFVALEVAEHIRERQTHMQKIMMYQEREYGRRYSDEHRKAA